MCRHCHTSEDLQLDIDSIVQPKEMLINNNNNTMDWVMVFLQSVGWSCRPRLTSLSSVESSLKISLCHK